MAKYLELNWKNYHYKAKEKKQKKLCIFDQKNKIIYFFLPEAD